MSWLNSGVTLYTGSNFTGSKQTYGTPGWYPLAASPASFKVSPGWTATLYFDSQGMMPVGTYSSNGTGPVNVGAFGSQAASIRVGKSEMMLSAPAIHINVPSSVQNLGQWIGSYWSPGAAECMVAKRQHVAAARNQAARERFVILNRPVAASGRRSGPVPAATSLTHGGMGYSQGM
jgi:hypothetical protein